MYNVYIHTYMCERFKIMCQVEYLQPRGREEWDLEREEEIMKNS